MERGLVQRIQALNKFLHDIYHDQRIVKEGLIPEDVVKSAKHFRPEFMGFDVPKDIYIHICGSDLIRDREGNYLVLEDNGRCPSGVSYVLENRQVMKRVFPKLFNRHKVRPVDHYGQELLNCLRYVAPAHCPHPERSPASSSSLPASIIRPTSSIPTSRAPWASRSWSARISWSQTTSFT